jgi:phytoene synthase
MLQGMHQDLTQHRYQTWEELFSYCDAVASSVGLMCLDIMGLCSREHVDYALATGRALQLTNILRDLREDAQRGRVYLPQQHWQAHGLMFDDFLNKPGPAMQEMLTACLPRVHALYEESLQLSKHLPAKQIWPTRIMADVYHALFQKIQRRPLRVFEQRVRVSSWTKLFLAKKHKWKSKFG